MHVGDGAHAGQGGGTGHTQPARRAARKSSRGIGTCGQSGYVGGMTGSELREVREVMTDAIMRAIPDPAGWLLALRLIVEGVGLAPEKCIPLGGVTLQLACFEVANYMGKNQIPMDRIRGALPTHTPGRQSQTG